MWKKGLILFFVGLLLTSCEFPAPGDFELEDVIACDSNALIDAINFANDSPNSQDTINLEMVCHYVLTAVDNSTDGDNGLPSIESPVVINGNGAWISRSTTSGTPDFRIFHIQPGGSLTLNNVTISDGKLNTGTTFIWVSGGAILNQGSLNINDAEFADNSCLQGGGAIANYDTNALITVSNSEFNGNHAGVKGGAIFNEDGEVSVLGSNFSGNDAKLGGAIFTDGLATISGSEFYENHAEKGGAIKNFIGDLSIIGSTIERNQADHGGGIQNSSGGLPNELTITDSTIASNIALTGSAIYNQNAGVIYIMNSTVSGNLPGGQNAGNAIHNQGFIDIQYSTIAKNLTVGIYSYYRTDVTNSIIANAPYPDCSVLNSNGFNVLGSNLDSDGSCAGFSFTANPQLGPLADNGGLTQTHALLFNSLAIDAGQGSCPANDQRGNSRPGGAACDLGAFEYTAVVGIIENHTFCYFSPSKDYVAAHPIGAGTELEVVGHSEDLSFLAAISPLNPNLLCYIDEEDFIFPEPLFGLQVLHDPPNPIDPPERVAPDDPADPEEPSACHAGLDSEACKAVGGTWNVTTNKASCVCP